MGHLSWLMRSRWRMETVHMVMSRLVCTSHSARPSGHRPSSSMAALGSITRQVDFKEIDITSLSKVPTIFKILRHYA